MYRKILSFILVLCLCMGMMPSTNVHAAELQDNEERTFFAAEDIESDEQDMEENEIKIPQNGSKVRMGDVAKTQPVANGRRLMRKATSKRYTVLVLDTSSSVSFLHNGSPLYTADTALPYVKKASKKFVEDMKAASDDNYIAIVCYGANSSKVVSQFTNDTNALVKSIDSLYESGHSNVCSGLTDAEKLIDSISDQSAIKNVVLFTTGMTGTGEYSYSGAYNTSTVGSNWYNTGTNIPLYAYANSAYAAAENLKEKCTVYSIGLFNVLNDMPEQGRDVVKFFKLCACDWASSKKHFYDVKDPADLEFVFGQVADNIVKRTGTFSYPGKGKDYTATYYYDDNYFKDSSYKFNQQLATMSLCLELSAWGSEAETDYTRKMKNAEDLLNELEFVGFDHNYTDFTEGGINGKPTKDSVGVVAANKPLSFDGKDYTLIAVAIRGGGYEKEWASNFTIGKSGDHEGFTRARNIVITFLEEYIKEQGISGNIKIWLTGYSRAGATANMVAGALDNRAGDLCGCKLELKDLFVYTFETPAGVVDPDAKNEKYNNIFNILNKNDPVPRVAPSDWDFKRYGVDQYISSPEVDGKLAYRINSSAMMKAYRQMDGYEGYDVKNFKMIDVKVDLKSFMPGGNPLVKVKGDLSQSEFLDEFISVATKECLKDRTNYVGNYQNGVRDICGIFFGTDSTKKDKLFFFLEKNLKDNLTDIIYQQCIKKDKQVTSRMIADCLEKSLMDAEINYSHDEFGEAAIKLSDLVAEFVKNHPNYFATLILNHSGIIQAHYPELCLAWMQSKDENYTTDAKLGYTSGKYRIVRINCPIDVTIYDAEGNVLASILDDTPQPDSQVMVSLNHEGEKLVYLPVYHDYVIKLVATDDGVMNYAVQEYDPNAGETNHLVLFNDIEITNGQEYTAYLPSYSEADIECRTGTAADTDYTLFLGTEQILYSEELTGEEVFNAYYDVNATADDEEMGFVFGSGIRQYGTFAKVTAVAYEGYEPAGWYEDGNLVSTEAEYRFRVSRDVELVAVFKESSQEKTPEENPSETPGENTGEDTGKNTDQDTSEDPADERKGTVDGAFRVVSHWNTGFNGEITLTNTKDEAIHNWTVAFDLPYEITNIWNGVITSHEDGVYTVQNAGYNWDIQPGESVTFGFCANAETETITEPTYYTLIEKPARIVKESYEIAYKMNSDWETAFIGQIEISNMSSERIFDWILEFDSDHNFNKFWNAEIVSHEGSHYVIKNKGYNAVIGAGQTLVLEFEASCNGEDSSQEPVNYNLVTVDME